MPLWCEWAYQMPIYLDVAGSEGEGDDAKREGAHDSHAVDAPVGAPHELADQHHSGEDVARHTDAHQEPAPWRKVDRETAFLL